MGYTRILPMRAVLLILFGAGFTVSVAIAMGTLLLGRLRLTFHRQEAMLFAFVSGAACLSLATFLLCLVGEASEGVFLVGGLAVIAWAVWDSQRRAGKSEPARKSLPPLPLAWSVPFWIILTVFFAAYFFNALAPEVSPDGAGYHLGNVARFARSHGFVWGYHSFYASLSQGAEMLFLVAFTFGGHSAAAMVHFAFLSALPLLMVCYGRRYGFPRAGLFAAVLAYTCPIMGLDGVLAYNDLAVATVVFAVFYLLQVWDELQYNKLLIIIGLLSGFCFAIKYTAFLALPFAAAFVTLRPRVWQRLLLLFFPSAIIAVPWLLRNWIWLGNPAAPFLNRWFPNPYFHPGIEQSIISDVGHYEGIRHWWEIPLQLTLHGKLIAGMVGPAVLLAPFALLALRNVQGRRLLAAAVVFAIPAYFNTGARFLIPVIPFLSLAMGIALANSWGVLPALAVFEALVCWPSILSLYCDPVAWRIRDIPVRAALRLEAEAEFLSTHLRDYALKEPIERNVGPNEKILSFSTRAESYIDREIIVAWESGEGNLAHDILTSLYHSPVVRRRFRFAMQSTRGVRVVEHASREADWTVTEIRFLLEGRELPRSPGWRFTAWPNPGEASLAFDGSPATRWSTWQSMSPGCRLVAQTSQPVLLDEVLLEGPVDAAQLTLELLIGDRWIPSVASAEEYRAEASRDLRLAATRELQGRGIRYLLIDDSDSTGPDMKQNPGLWGITKLAEANGTSLYRID